MFFPIFLHGENYTISPILAAKITYFIYKPSFIPFFYILLIIKNIVYI